MQSIPPSKSLVKKSCNLSVIIITKNEEKKIAKTILSAKFANEIIVYDCGSSDKTTEIATSMGARTIIDPIWQGFGKQRNKAQKKARWDWILMLDADEVISKPLQKSIKKALKTAKNHHIFQLSRLTYCFGGFIRHGGWYPDWVARIYHKENHQFNTSLVHEKLITKSSDKIIRLKGDLMHFSYDNLEHYLVKSARYAEDWANSKINEQKNFLILRGIGHGIFCFVRIYFLRFGLLDGKAGFILSLLSGHSTFCKYLALWEKTKINSKRPESD